MAACGAAQESSSEAVNGYYGVYLMGLARGDEELADWGRLLLAMELRSAKKWGPPISLPFQNSIASLRVTRCSDMACVPLLVQTWLAFHSVIIGGPQTAARAFVQRSSSPQTAASNGAR